MHEIHDDTRLAALGLALTEISGVAHVSGAHLSAMRRLLSTHCRAMSRSNFEPGHFTASGFVVSPDQTSLLLIRHKKLGMWLQPGGHIEPTDAGFVEAALREVLEETGVADVLILDRLFDIDVHEIPAYFEQPKHQHFDLRVLLQAETEQIAAGVDVADACWFSIEKLATSAGPLADGLDTDHSVREVARRLLAGAASRVGATAAPGVGGSASGAPR
jgi:8-oxo-dGTP pyrophosphatase MutT (NUDIX family)